jgi:hypothetical protein
MIDHRASPGIPEGYFQARGFDMPEVPGGKMLEMAVLHCKHCQQPFFKNPMRTRERASCQKCGGVYICDVCEWLSRQSDYVHTPFQKIIDNVMDGKPVASS